MNFNIYQYYFFIFFIIILYVLISMMRIIGNFSMMIRILPTNYYKPFSWLPLKWKLSFQMSC